MKATHKAPVTFMVHHEDSLQLPNRSELSPGVEFTANVLGRNLRLSFRAFSTGKSGAQWIDAWDGRRMRSVSIDSVERVHRSRKITRG